MYCTSSSCCFFFFFNDAATTEIYTLSTRRSSDLVFRGLSPSELPLAGLVSRPDSVCFARLMASISSTGDSEEMKDRKSTRLNSSHANTSYAVFCWKKKRTVRSLDLAFSRPYLHRL